MPLSEGILWLYSMERVDMQAEAYSRHTSFTVMN